MSRARWISGAAGIAAPLVYAAAVLTGGALDPHYSHVANTISELTMAGAPHRGALAASFVLYNLLVVVFAAGLPAALPRSGVTAAVLLIVNAIAGIAMVTAFPTDLPDDPLTADGQVHIALAAVSSIGTIAVVALVAWALWGRADWHGLAVASAVCVGLILVSGIAAGVSAALLSPWMGLAERATIGIFMLWLFAFAVAVLRRQ